MTFGDVYEGEFREGAKEGEGKLIYSNGAEYIGTWVADCAEGRGVMKYAEGEEYEGDWRQNKRHG